MLLPLKSPGLILRMFSVKGENKVEEIWVQFLLQSEATRVESTGSILPAGAAPMGDVWRLRGRAGGLPQRDPCQQPAEPTTITVRQNELRPVCLRHGPDLPKNMNDLKTVPVSRHLTAYFFLELTAPAPPA